MSLLSELPVQFQAQGIGLKLPIESKKRAIERISELAAKAYNMDADLIYESLLAREKMGATGLGAGLAIPHCRLETLSTPAMVVITLAEPIDYGAQDHVPVDTMWTLLVPSSADEAHLQLLAAIANFLRDETLTTRLRQADDPAQLFQLIEEKLCLPQT